VTCATYSINWLVFITEISVYSAVRTGSLNKAVCASALNTTWYKIFLGQIKGLIFQPM
jgi:hypothetical protein